jgi:hypothetical protein
VRCEDRATTREFEFSERPADGEKLPLSPHDGLISMKRMTAEPEIMSIDEVRTVAHMPDVADRMAITERSELICETRRRL